MYAVQCGLTLFCLHEDTQDIGDQPQIGVALLKVAFQQFQPMRCESTEQGALETIQVLMKKLVNNLSRKRESGECEKCKNIFRRALRLPVHIGEKGSVQESVKSRYENVNFLICTAGEYSWLWELAKIQISYLSLHLNTASGCSLWLFNHSSHQSV